MTTPLALMRLHVEALYTHDVAGDIVRVNELDGAPAPRFFLGRTAEGPLWRFRYDVDSETRRELEAQVRSGTGADDPLGPPGTVSRYEEILARAAPVERTSAGPAFAFPESLAAPNEVVHVTADTAPLLEPHLRAWIGDIPLCQPMIVAVADGHAVAICCSVRRTSDANEAGVETAPPYRGRGYAARVTTAWAQAVRGMGLVPLYSTSWQNPASRAVARKLGLIQFGSDLHFT